MGSHNFLEFFDGLADSDQSDWRVSRKNRKRVSEEYAQKQNPRQKARILK